MLWLGLIGVGYLVVFVATEFVVGRLPRRRTTGVAIAVARVGAHLFFLALAAEGAAWVVLEAQLGANPRLQPYYYDVFEPKQKETGDELEYTLRGTALYEKHHYLNYALNPKIAYNGTRQFNEQFLIRRGEAVRPRDEVTWRAVVIGGSTTFDTQIDTESDTWVYQTELRLRNRFGPRIDVINGGVGGYTTYENLIHYQTLLTFLDPDVVVLYEGINDVHPRLLGDIEFDYRNYRAPFRSALFVEPHPWLRHSSAYRLHYFTRNIRAPLTEGIEFLTASREYAYPESEEAIRALLARNGPEIFTRALRHLIAAVVADGRQVLVLPQHYISISPVSAGRKVGVDEHNEVARRLAAELDVPFVDAILREDAFAQRDVNDDCHFNPTGAAKMADIVGQALLDAFGEEIGRPFASASNVGRASDDDAQSQPARIQRVLRDETLTNEPSRIVPETRGQ